MGKVTISADWYNPSNPKCRNCRWYFVAGSNWVIGECINKDAKVIKNRDHNSKACSFFRVTQLFDKQKECCHTDMRIDTDRRVRCIRENLCVRDIDYKCCTDECPMNIVIPEIPLYFVENLERGPVGNCIQFWREGDRGYTCDISKAQKFTYGEALKLVQGRDKYQMWPVKFMLDNTVRHCHHNAIDNRKSISNKTLKETTV